MKTPTLSLNRLILIGYRKNYTVQFYPGVNIIYGDSDTGKSSILDLVNYMLGASKIDMYVELESSVSHANLELCINGETYTIVRDIHNSKSLIEVYSCSYDSKKDYFPVKYSPNFNIDSPNGYYSDFLLDSLNLPKLKIKQSPSKADSKMSRLSFRDLFKFCYLNQDDVGSKSMLNMGDYILMTKNNEVFKYIHNLLDDNISSVQEDISYNETQKRNFQNQFDVIEQFFKEIEFSSYEELNTKIEEVDNHINEFSKNLTQLNNTMTTDSQNYRELKSIHENIKNELKQNSQVKHSSSAKINKFTKLKNDYHEDVLKLKSIIDSSNFIDVKNEQTGICPVCDSQINVGLIQEKFTMNKVGEIENEIKSLKRRVKDIDLLLEENREQFNLTLIKEKELNESLLKVKNLLDEESSSFISPYISDRDNIVIEIANLKSEKKELENHRKFRNQQRQISKKINIYKNNITILNQKLNELKEKSSSIDQVRFKMIGHLYNFLKDVSVSNIEDTNLNKYNLPMIRGKNYNDISSGGVRTIVSIGYFCSLLKYGLEVGINLPNILMLDTIGKYIGKNSKETDIKEGMSDPAKYQKLYECFLNIVEFAEDNNKSCQILIVDNDVPDKIQKEYAGHIIEKFSKDRKPGFKIGLIDDYNPNLHQNLLDEENN